MFNVFPNLWERFLVTTSAEILLILQKKTVTQVVFKEFFGKLRL